MIAESGILVLKNQKLRPINVPSFISIAANFIINDIMSPNAAEKITIPRNGMIPANISISSTFLD